MFFKKIKYTLDIEGNVLYYKTKKGDEKYMYNDRKEALFIKDKQNNQIYARDRYNNEIYPSKGYPFAMDKFGQYYYAKNKNLDEYYPKFKGISLMIRERGGDVLIAKYKSTKQRYPTDKRGNNYFPVDRHNQPFYLLDEFGKTYYPKTRKNYAMCLKNRFDDGTTCYNCKRDCLNNIYYTNQRGGQMFQICQELTFCVSSIITTIALICSLN